MLIQQILSVILIHFSMCIANGPYQEVITTISTTINNRKTSKMNCQDCLLSSGSASRAILLRSHVEKYNTEVAIFKFTAPRYGLVLIEQYCKIRSECGEFEVHEPYRLDDHSIIQKNGLPMSMLCLAQTSRSARCRACLKEVSDSAYLGNFVASGSESERFVSLRILFTSRKATDIIALCSASQACAGSTVHLPRDICVHLVPEYLKSHVTSHEEGTITPAARNTAKPMKSLQNQIRSTNRERRCFELSHTNMEEVRKCLHSLAIASKGLAVMLHQDLKIKYAYTYGDIPKDLEKHCGKPILEVDISICNARNAHHYDTFPISNQISVYSDTGASIEQANGKIKYTSECVWEQHNPSSTDCESCIAFLDVSAKQTTQLSKSTSLTALSSAFEKRKLASCISQKKHSSCDQLVFVPNFMCGHELKYNIFDQERQQGTTYSRLYDSVGSSSNPRNSPYEYLESSRGSILLFGTQIGKFQTLALVQFQSSDAQACLESLALKYNVFVISLINQYVWMHHEPDQSLSNVGSCTNLAILGTLEPDLDMLRAISAEDVKIRFSLERSDTTA